MLWLFIIMIAHTLNMCEPYIFCTFDNIFGIVERRHYYVYTTFGVLTLFICAVLEISQRIQLVRRATWRQMQLAPHNYNLPCTNHSFIKFLKMLIHEKFVCLRLYTVNNFSVILGQLPGFNQSNWDKCLAQGHNTRPQVRIKPATLWSRVRHSPMWKMCCNQCSFNMYRYGSKYGDTMANSEGPN